MTAITTPAGTSQARSAPDLGGALEVLALSPTEWRVRATGSPEGASESAVGVIQLIGDTYEVMQIGTPLCRYYFASLEDAVEHLGATEVA